MNEDEKDAAVVKVGVAMSEGVAAYDGDKPVTQSQLMALRKELLKKIDDEIMDLKKHIWPSSRGGA